MFTLTKDAWTDPFKNQIWISNSFRNRETNVLSRRLYRAIGIAIPSINNVGNNSAKKLLWTRWSAVSYGRSGRKSRFYHARGVNREQVARGWNTPLAPACFQHFGQLPVACKRPAISPLSNLVLAAYHRSDDQITWPLVTSRSWSKHGPCNSIARTHCALLAEIFLLPFIPQFYMHVRLFVLYYRGIAGDFALLALSIANGRRIINRVLDPR